MKLEQHKREQKELFRDGLISLKVWLKDYWRRWLIVFVFIAIVVLILLSGCEQQSSKSLLSTIEPSEMILQINDFPEEWKLTLRAERVSSDVSNEGLDMGWKKGYMTTYAWQDENNQFSGSQIHQDISVYPLENISKILKYNKSKEGFVHEELSNPNIGEESVAYKITLKDNKGYMYRIIFYKKDIVMTLSLLGTVQDYELLKEMTKKAEEKIK